MKSPNVMIHKRHIFKKKCNLKDFKHSRYNQRDVHYVFKTRRYLESLLRCLAARGFNHNFITTLRGFVINL